MNLTRYLEQMRENVRRFYVKRPTDSWTKIRDLRHTLIRILLHQDRFGTGDDETIQKEEDVRHHAGGMPLLTDLSLAMRTDPLALIRGATEFVTVICGPAVTFAKFSDAGGPAVTLYRNFLMQEEMKSKGPRVQEKIQDNTMVRQEAVDWKSLCSRNPIRLRKRTTKLRLAGCPAWTSTSSATLKRHRHVRSDD